MNIRYEPESKRKIEEARAVAHSSSASVLIAEASLKEIDKLSEELYAMEHTKDGKLRDKLTPSEEQRKADILKNLETIKTANTGIAEPRTWQKFFSECGEQWRKSSSPKSIAKNLGGLAVCVGATIAVGLIFGNPLGILALGAAATGLILFGAIKLLSWCVKTYRAYANDTPQARMDAAAVKAGLRGTNLQPSGATPSGGVTVNVNNQTQGKDSATNEPAPSRIRPKY